MKKLLITLVFIFGIGNAFCQIPIADIPYAQNDFEDLAFLKEELKGKQIVCLGEEWHFTETFSQMKNRLVKYLHQELGYTVIVFESSFQAAWIAESENLENKERLFETVQTIWRTESVLDLMNYFSETKKGDLPITQYGLDLYGTYTKRFENKLANYLTANQPILSKVILSIENKIQEDYIIDHHDQGKFKTKVTKDDLEKYENLLTFVKKDVSSFETQKEKEYFVRAIENRILLGESFLNGEKFFREKIMADNINWIVNHIGKDEKVIIWAADIHISKSQKKTVRDGDKSMIELLPNEIKDQVYSLSLIPVSSTPKKVRKKLMAKEDRFFFYSLSEENGMKKRKDEFDGMVICKFVESIEKYKIK